MAEAPGKYGVHQHLVADNSAWMPYVSHSAAGGGTEVTGQEAMLQSGTESYLLSSNSLALRKLYPLPPITLGFSFLSCQMDMWAKHLASEQHS